ncbi:MAG: ABC transporter ATP-binding protein, partial [candidate division NC10 bacterium]
MASSVLLAVEDLQTFYGKSHVLRGVSFTVPPGEITVLLGRNGAGKTTTLRSIMGLTPPRGGTIRFKGEDITGRAPHHVFRRGVGYVPEGRQIFPHLDVGENLRLAERAGGDGTRWTLARIFEYFPVLRERWRQKGRSLSGGEQQMLAIARALAGHPELLMLDEPSQGLAPRLVRELETLMLRLKGEGVTILLVEQNARMALAVSDRVLVL